MENNIRIGFSGYDHRPTETSSYGGGATSKLLYRKPVVAAQRLNSPAESFRRIHKRAGHHLRHHVSHRMRRLHARQLLIEPLILERETIVVHAQLVQDCGVHIANMDGIRDDVVTMVVGLAIFKTALDTGTRHPNCEAATMMIAAVIVFGQISL